MGRLKYALKVIDLIKFNYPSMVLAVPAWPAWFWRCLRGLSASTASLQWSCVFGILAFFNNFMRACIKQFNGWG